MALETSVECRKRDLVIRMSDWSRDRDEPGYDVEVYLHGSYQPEISKSFLTKNAGKSNKETKQEAITYAQNVINANFLKK